MAVTVANARRAGRVTRSPRHTFQTRMKPFVLTPFLLAPVLPGETLKSALMQVRAVTDPIRNPIIGWHLEHYLFYVKHRDLSIRDDLSEMMLDPDKDLSAHYSATNEQMYHSFGLDWMRLCYDRIVETYFRNEGETLAPSQGLYHKVALNFDFLGQNLTRASDFDGFADVAIPVDPGQAGEGDETISAMELDASMRMFQFQRANGMTEQTYEDWLATYGVRTPAPEAHRPELLRYVREWQYPSNTIDQISGNPTSAVSWAVSERLDKDRFFREPGFIVGVSCVRPKVYLLNQISVASEALQDALGWLPAILRDDPWTSLKQFPRGRAPYAVIDDAEGYWLDVKDLFVYGDQFVNYGRHPDGIGNFVTIPDATGNVTYPSDADIEDFFVGEDGIDRHHVRQDGVVQFNILGALQDTTPQLRAL